MLNDVPEAANNPFSSSLSCLLSLPFRDGICFSLRPALGWTCWLTLTSWMWQKWGSCEFQTKPLRRMLLCMSCWKKTVQTTSNPSAHFRRSQNRWWLCTQGKKCTNVLRHCNIWKVRQRRCRTFHYHRAFPYDHLRSVLPDSHSCASLFSTPII